MGQRNLEESGPHYGKGLVYLDFSFATNNTSSPLLTTLRGAGADAVATLTRTGVGIIQVTLKDIYRYVCSKAVDLEDLDSSDDGAYASIGPDTNDGSSPQKVATFKVYTRAAAGTKTDYNGRRVSVSLTLKNSTVGV